MAAVLEACNVDSLRMTVACPRGRRTTVFVLLTLDAMLWSHTPNPSIAALYALHLVLVAVSWYLPTGICSHRPGDSPANRYGVQRTDTGTGILSKACRNNKQQ